MRSLHEEDPKKYKILPLCKLFGKTVQGYYKTDWDTDSRKMALKRSLIDFAVNARERNPGLGSWKISYLYNQNVDEALQIGRDRALEWLNEAGMKLSKKRHKPRTTDSSHGGKTYPNLVWTFIPDRPGQLIVADITYVDLYGDDGKPFCYVSLVMDAYSREIIGWAVGDTLGRVHPIKALLMALKTLKERAPKPEVKIVQKDENSETVAEYFPLKGLIHHSDRGTQYASVDYTDILKDEKIKISMTESGNPKENSQAERVNGTLKNELLKDRKFKTVEEVEAAVKEAVDTYNNERPHMSLGMMTPAQAAKYTGALPMRWRSYKMEAILTAKKKVILEWTMAQSNPGIYAKGIGGYAKNVRMAGCEWPLPQLAKYLSVGVLPSKSQIHHDEL